MNTPATSDLTRTVLVLLIIAILIVGSLWTMLAFLSALLWAGTLVLSTWPLLLRVQRLTGGSRALAATIMTLLLAAIFVVPFGLAIGVLLNGAMEGFDLLKTVASTGFPSPPDWLRDIPWIGARLSDRWQELAAAGPDAALDVLRPYLRSTAGWAMSVTGGFGLLVVHFLVTLIIIGTLYTNGEAAAHGILMFAWRIGRERAEHAIRLAGQAVRSVALGVVVTALVESVIAGIGLVLAKVPRAGLLVAIVFVLCVAQLGPLLVLVPVLVWVFWSGHVVLGVVLAVFTVIVAACDNLLKPILIRRGIDLPLLLIIPGVIGGLFSFGVMGLFIGPVVLAVTYTLLVAWVKDDLASSRMEG
jgi:predicted PurR-regulated permease PerM